MESKAGDRDSLFRAPSYLDSREGEGPSVWFVVIVVVYVEWRYFSAVPKGRVVADTEILWWDARHYVWWWQSLVTGVLTACSSYTTVQGSSGGCGSSPGTVLNKKSLLLTPPMPSLHCFLPLLPLPCEPFLFTAELPSPGLPTTTWECSVTSAWPEHHLQLGQGASGCPWGRGTQAMLQVSFGDLWEPVKRVQAAGMVLGVEELWFLLPPPLSLVHSPVS